MQTTHPKYQPFETHCRGSTSRFVGFFVLVALLPLTGTSCKGEKEQDAIPEPITYPRLFVQDSQKALILERIEREPYLTVLARIRGKASQQARTPELEHWDYGAFGHNGEVAQASAFLAWLFDDEQAARKAIELLEMLRDDWETVEQWDVNIRMASSMIGFTNAWDLLKATPWFEEEQATTSREKLLKIADAFYTRYVLDDFYREMALGLSQNNHPIRTASSIGYVALAFADDPRSSPMLNWAVSELDYLLGTDGQYIQPGGGVSEGPHYFSFALSPALAMLLAIDNVIAPDHTFARDCINRSRVDPWNGYTCIDGDDFHFANPLHHPYFQASIDWDISLRMPTGMRPPIADAPIVSLNGGAFLSSIAKRGYYRWDWENNDISVLNTTTGFDLSAYHLVYVDDAIEANEPPWKTQFLPESGNTIFRSGWQTSDRWLLLMGENGSARKTLHDHVDGLSFVLAAYGELLLTDTGYYKPNSLNNAVTANAPSHNVLLIDGQGAPNKGILNSWGDQDAFLKNFVSNERLQWAEAWQDYESTQIQRGVAFVRERYFVVADRLDTEIEESRTYQWRIHANAGLDAGGAASATDCNATIERDLAGIDVRVATTAGACTFVEPPHTPLQPPHVHLFDADRTPRDHTVFDATLEAVEPNFLAVMVPYARNAEAGSPDGPLTIEEIEAGVGAAVYRVEHSDGDDVIWLRDDDAPTELILSGDKSFRTDGALTIISNDGASGLLVRGTRVQLNGTSIAQTSSDVHVW